MFIGEAPGADEDRLGRPFVGRAGQLLDKIIAAMNLKREQAYITNIVKCRPPNNRAPLPDEIDQYMPFLVRQINLIQPEVIVALGGISAKALMRTELGITKLRGMFHELEFKSLKVKLMPTFHPAYLLRNPSSKREVWADMQKVMKELSL
jgi:DNA polymerase